MGTAAPGKARQGAVPPGQRISGVAWHGGVGRGKARSSTYEFSEAGRGNPRRGQERQGTVQLPGKRFVVPMARLGNARQGRAWQCKVRQGLYPH